jgi:hypothetical protein
MWFFVEEPWQYRVLDRLPSGIDRAQLEACRQLTPTERLDAVSELVELGEELRQALEELAKKQGTT